MESYEIRGERGKIVESVGKLWRACENRKKREKIVQLYTDYKNKENEKKKASGREKTKKMETINIGTSEAWNI